MSKVNRRPVDVSSYPNLVVIYLGMRVSAFTGITCAVGPPEVCAFAGRPRPHVFVSTATRVGRLCIRCHSSVRIRARSNYNLRALKRPTMHARTCNQRRSRQFGKGAGEATRIKESED